MEIKIKQALEKCADPAMSDHKKFFRTGKGDYSEHDIFLGVTVPKQRALAKKYMHCDYESLSNMLGSKTHEFRLTALLILVEKYSKLKDQKKEVYEFYMNHISSVNNWDLVDVTAPKIVGDYLLDKNRAILYDLAHSNDLWEKRIAIMSTFAFIRAHEFEDTLNISEILVNDTHDLIHKAVGWMLREVGKRNQDIEEAFLKQHHKTMPRTMLRYAIEKFSQAKRKLYMQK